MAQQQNFEMSIGESAFLTVSASTKSLGVITPIDLTGKLLFFKVTKIGPNGDDVFEKTIGSGITVTDADSGVFDVTIDPADTEEFLANNVTVNLKWVLKMTYSGIVRILKSGTITLTPVN
jgi:hypothetical protein